MKWNNSYGFRRLFASEIRLPITLKTPFPASIQTKKKDFLYATLFDPLIVGDLKLPNRIIYAPPTPMPRLRRRVPNDLMREYYTQRASAGLILSEAKPSPPMGRIY